MDKHEWSTPYVSVDLLVLILIHFKLAVFG